MRLVLTLVACALLAGCDHLYGGVDGGGRHDRSLAPAAHSTAIAAPVPA
ncbi:MAG: hypothetical protein JWP49_1587 [Phenylobacterium sp.]|jgi:hypothetical protein|nr:hypothetical protein [Phenylobacterium sp.]